METRITTANGCGWLVLASACASVLLLTASSDTVRARQDDGLGMAVMGARIDGDGTLLSGSGVTNVNHVGTGQYEVDFDRDVSSCVFAVTPADLRLPEAQTAASANGVAVGLVGQSGISLVFADDQFDLILYCPK
jgi:hypothetical protein